MRCSTQGASHTSHLWPHRRSCSWGTSPSCPGSPPGRALLWSTLALVGTPPSPWGWASGGQAKVNGAKSAWAKCGRPGAGSGEGSLLQFYDNNLPQAPLDHRSRVQKSWRVCSTTGGPLTPHPWTRDIRQAQDMPGSPAQGEKVAQVVEEVVKEGQQSVAKDWPAAGVRGGPKECCPSKMSTLLPEASTTAYCLPYLYLSQECRARFPMRAK